MSSTATTAENTGRPAEEPITVEVWTDLGCPWCYLGEPRLDQAIENVGSDRFEVVLRPYQLDPHADPTPETIPEIFVRKHGGTRAQAVAMESSMADLAHNEGLPFTVDRLSGNTFDALRALALATSHGVGREFFRDLKRGFFAGETNPYDTDTLVNTLARAGVPADEARTALHGDAFAAEVTRDRQTAQSLGITSVPFVVLDGRLGVAGAQSLQDYERALRTALGEQS